MLMLSALALFFVGCGSSYPPYSPEDQARFDKLGADLDTSRGKTRALEKKLAGQFKKTTDREKSKGAKTSDVVVCGATVGSGGFGKLVFREKPNRRATFTSKGSKAFGARTCNVYEVKVVK